MLSVYSPKQNTLAKLVADLELRHPVPESRSRETAPQRMSPEAAEVADPSARQGSFEDPGHRGRVEGRQLHVLSPIDLAEHRPALDVGLAQPLFEGPVEVGLIGVCVFGLVSGFPVAGLIG